MARSAQNRSRVSIIKLFKFASFADGLLIIFGSIFAVLEGTGPALMAIVFGGLTTTLTVTVQNGLSSTPNSTAPDSANITTTTTTSAFNSTTANTLAPFALGNQDGAPTTTLATDVSPPDLDLLSPEQFELSMSQFALFYALIGVFIYFSSLIQIACWQTACERQIHRMRRAFFMSVLRQELSWFDKNRSGELSAKLNDDIERIRDGLGEQCSSIIKYTSSFLSGFLVGLILSWRLTLIIMIVTPVLAILSASMGKMLATSTKREQEKYATAGALAEEVLTTVRTVFALGGQRLEIKNYTKKLNEGKKMAISKYIKLGLIFAGLMFMVYSTYGIALYVATDLISKSLITPGNAMSVIMAVMMGAGSLGHIVPPFQSIIVAAASASIIYEIIDSVPHIDAFSERGLKLSKVTANIKFENVTFAYPLRESVPVIKNLNLEIAQGQSVAICGRTGSGKSTIMNLLLRFYDPQQGSVYLDNCNLSDLNVAWLRSLVGIVEQEPALFDCSILENIALGSTQELTQDYGRIVEAAKLANAHEFIVNLPDGYNTRCGDRGVQMSGGQKQRVAIARALLCDPKILLLDEATSALDGESEFMVQSALNKARQGRTTIIIAHRLSTIRDADLICVMDNGIIVESGHHEELMSKRGEYFNLVTNQVFGDDDQQRAKREAGKTQQAGGRTRLINLDSDSAGESARLPRDIECDDDCDNDEDEDGLGVRPLSSMPLGLSGSSSLMLSVSGVFDNGSVGRKRSFASSQTALAETGTNAAFVTRRRRTSSRIVSSPDLTSTKKKHSTTLYESINGPIKSLVEFESGQMDQSKLLMPTLKELLRLVKPEWMRYLMSLSMSVLSGAILPVFGLFYAEILNTFSKTGNELLESGSFWALMFLALAIANFITLFLRIFTMSYAIEVTMARLRSECFVGILRQHVGWFDSPNHSPQRLTTRLASDVPQIKSVLNTRLSTFIGGMATILTSLLIAFYLGWQLAILLTLALPLLIWVGFIQMSMARGSRQKNVERMENASRLATEVIEHVKLVQSINQEAYFFRKFCNELEEPYKQAMVSARRFALFYGLSQSIVYFVFGASFRWGAYLIARDIIDPINMLRVFFSVAFTATTVGQWGGFGGDINRANMAVAMIMKLLNTQPAIDNLSRGGIKPVFQGSISFQDIHFNYPTRPDTRVLCGFNLSIRAGQTLALVGPSGSGKSTIGSLLLRFYDPVQGSVRIDNYDVRCINLNHLRLNVGLVSQEPVLFKASIRDNILYGLDRTKYSQKDVVRAAKLANIDEFISSLPNKYDTQVGERGSQMSGGQKQRIAIARTMIRNPTILILDEATSALDSESEAVVNQALEKASQGKTCIKIAHRLSTVRDADQIAVIERGQIVEIGTHEELMALGKRGYYFKLMEKQEITS